VVHFGGVNGAVTAHAQSEHAPAPAFPATMPLPADVAWAKILISANGHLAFATRDAEGITRVWWDGKVYATHPATETIYCPPYAVGCIVGPRSSLTLSADGARIGYLLDVQEPADSQVVDPAAPRRRIMVIDGKRSGEYLDATPPIFSADGTQVAYAAHEQDAGWRVWRNGVPGPSFERITLRDGGGLRAGPPNDPGFSADGRHFCYVGYRKDGYYAVVDDTEYGPYRDIFGLTFAGDGRGKHLFGFIAVSVDNYRDSMAVVVDGEAQPSSTDIDGPVFSDDGNHLAYIGNRGRERDRRESYLVRDGQESKLEQMSMLGMPPRLSHDGKHVAYLTRDETTTSWFLDDPRLFSLEEFHGARFLSWTPDGESIVFIHDNTLSVRGKVTADYPHVPYYWRDYTFTPDGTLAYVCRTDDGKRQVVVGDRAYPPVDGDVDALTILPGGDVLYAVRPQTPEGRRTDGINVYVNDTLHGSYEIMLPFPYDIQQRFFVDAPDRVHYFAIRDGLIHRVEVAL